MPTSPDKLRIYHNNMNTTYVSIFEIVLVLLSGMPLMSGGAVNSVYAKYATNTQSQANTNNCNNGTNCAINSPQTQGDGSASSPTNLQISKFNQRQQGGVGQPSCPDCEAMRFEGNFV